LALRIAAAISPWVISAAWAGVIETSVTSMVAGIVAVSRLSRYFDCRIIASPDDKFSEAPHEAAFPLLNNLEPVFRRCQ
jgi:hypothetical protein